MPLDPWYYLSREREKGRGAKEKKKKREREQKRLGELIPSPAVVTVPLQQHVLAHDGGGGGGGRAACLPGQLAPPGRPAYGIAFGGDGGRRGERERWVDIVGPRYSLRLCGRGAGLVDLWGEGGDGGGGGSSGGGYVIETSGAAQAKG